MGRTEKVLPSALLQGHVGTSVQSPAATLSLLLPGVPLGVCGGK